MEDFRGGNKDSRQFLTALSMDSSQRSNYGSHLRNDTCRKNGENMLQQRLLLLLIISIITLIIIITITVFTTILKCLTFVIILLTIHLNCNMIPCLFQLNLCPLSSSIYFYQNWLTTTIKFLMFFLKKQSMQVFYFKRCS